MELHLEPLLLHAEPLMLRLLGVEGDQYTPEAIKPFGAAIEVPAGLFSDPDHQLGVINLERIELPEEALTASWLLCGYELSRAGKRKEALRLPLCDAQRMHRTQLPFIPPGAIQPGLQRQPMFALSVLERNPCPGWVERVHLYRDPDQPFEISSVMYLGGNMRIGAVEMFNIALRHTHHPALRRIWLSMSY